MMRCVSGQEPPSDLSWIMRAIMRSTRPPNRREAPAPYFEKCADVEDHVVGVERFERRKTLALESYPAIRTVLDDVMPCSAASWMSALRTLQRHGDAGRIMKVGDVVDELRPCASPSR